MRRIVFIFILAALIVAVAVFNVRARRRQVVPCSPARVHDALEEARRQNRIVVDIKCTADGGAYLLTAPAGRTR